MVKDLSKLLLKKLISKFYILILSIFALLVSFFELLSVAMIVPVINIISDSNFKENNYSIFLTLEKTLIYLFNRNDFATIV